jgi:8-oxo-dGTP pyrophosphatase MutT (NUDIX family)
MDKFSKLRSKNSYTPKEDVLFKKGALKVINYEDWTLISHSDVVVCIPVLIESNQIVLRYEYIPTFKYVDGQEYHVTLVAGKIEKNEEPKSAILRELEEEAGIVIREDYKIEDMKPLYTNKGSVNKVYPFILPLTERDYHEISAKGDGSKAESLSKAVKIDIKHIDQINTSDIITEYMLLKVKEYLNIQKY